MYFSAFSMLCTRIVKVKFIIDFLISVSWLIFVPSKWTVIRKKEISLLFGILKESKEHWPSLFQIFSTSFSFYLKFVVHTLILLCCAQNYWWLLKNFDKKQIRRHFVLGKIKRVERTHTREYYFEILQKYVLSLESQ